MQQALDHEILGEKAATYRRLSETLERSLSALAAFDEQGDGDPDRRDRLVNLAAQALWHVVVQRDLMRLPGTERYLRALGVADEIRLRMGARR